MRPTPLGQHPYNLLIRVDIDPISLVGGAVMPANTPAILPPWLMVIGLLCIGTVVVVAKKRQS